MKKSSFIRASSLFIFLIMPALAQAHPQIGGSTGFARGLAHPMTGIDHICAMVAVGLWAAQRGGRALWLVPLVFVSVMTIGGLLGMMAISLPFVEPGIAASVLVLGILIAASVRLPLIAGALLVGLFALFHGHAHGSEMPVTASGVFYGLGFIISTVILHLCGIGLGLAAREARAVNLIRYAGGGIAACGIYLCCSI